LGAGANAVFASPGEQQVEQAQRDFINAVLRRESGAVISNDEFANGRRQYFPQPGDTPQVIEQKRRNREMAIQGIMMEVPKGTQMPSVGGFSIRKLP
jgi:3-deoxy-D-arabino-heptulosonate 7-phosphate (DAHP) synthase